MTKSSDFLPLMLKMAGQAGELALKFSARSSPSLKSDRSVITKADLAISKLIRKNLTGLLKTKDHTLIDEEDKDNAQYFDPAVLSRAPYIWAVDPIDGTRGFANGLPLFGVSIGLLRELKPWLGVVYFPALKELFYCDGKYSTFVEQAFTRKEKRRRLKPIDQEITKLRVFFANDGFIKRFDWDYNFCQLMMASCAVVDLCWPTIGRGCGSIMNANLWDFAGSWPIGRAAGMELRSFADGKVMDRLDAGDYIGVEPKIWRLKEQYILSSERNFLSIKQHIQARSA